ncbi:MAG: T9SS type A sorting domain-containing protein [Bacteroidetes bacterium]|nr:T9SS type A sorting domain-containing protein [Bacteroidota bacterium]
MTGRKPPGCRPAPVSTMPGVKNLGLRRRFPIEPTATTNGTTASHVTPALRQGRLKAAMGSNFPGAHLLSYNYTQTKTTTMKTTTLLSFLAFFTFYGTLHAQIPNPGFENWSGDALDGWNFTYSEPGYENVFQSTDAAQGSYSVRLKPVYNDLQGNVPRAAINSGYFPLTTAYASLNGQIKGTLAGGDSFVITVDLFKDGGTLAVGSYETTASTSEWTSFTAPINYGISDIPDSAYIHILVTQNSTATVGSDFLVDGLAFGDPAGIDERQQPSELTLYPNPAQKQLTLSFTLNEPDQMTFRILDPAGQIQSTLHARAFMAGPNSISLLMAELPTGIYFLHAIGEKYGFTEKLMIR